MVDITEARWLEEAPPLPGPLCPSWVALWREGWALHQRSCRAPIGMLDDIWISAGQGYHVPAFGHWDIVHSVLDILSYDPALAARQIRLVVRTLRRTDGRLPGLVRVLANDHGQEELVPDYQYSPPPLWPTAVLPIYHALRDTKFLKIAYEGAGKCLRWYEENRRLPGGLFWFGDCVGDRQWESGYDDCPRWDGLEGRVKPLACADLCGQMGMCYESMAAIADLLGSADEAATWRGHYERLAGLVRNTLWHDDDGLFYDRDTETGGWVRVKTVACFWPMVAGQATAAQVDRLVEHLGNREEFLADVPVPSVALDDPTFSYDMWRGPTWLSQTYWVMRGLLRYGCKELAGRIGTAALAGAAASLEKNGAILEFHHPSGGSIGELTRKGDACGPRRNYIGHNPVHAMALMLADDCPQANAIGRMRASEPAP
jgi:putative isomerase